jgi:hypothetical protein
MAAYKNPVPRVDDIEREDNETQIEVDYNIIEPIYFVFIDILGFKKTYDDNRNSKGMEFADGYKAVFNYYFDLLNASYLIAPEHKTNYAGQTSDSLYFYTSRPDHLLIFIKIFSHLNMFAMSKNVFFRGGIAKGSLFRKEAYQFYGDSVIYAYLIESVIAKNPVIYIDKSTYEDLNDDSNECDQLFSMKNRRYYIKPFIWFEENNSINLESLLSDSIELKQIDKTEIKNKINNNLKVFEYDGRNYDKYVFLYNELNNK